LYEDSLYSYTVKGSNRDVADTVIKYLLGTYPSGMTIDSVTGLIQWIPENKHVGDNKIVVALVNSDNGVSTQQFMVTVINVNDPPQITGPADTISFEDSLYSFTVPVEDVDVGDTLVFSLLAAPDSMTINPDSGIIRWIPVNNDVGAHLVSILVDDGNGGTDTLAYTLTVTNTNDAPVISNNLFPDFNTELNDSGVLSWQAALDVDVGDTLTYELECGTTPAFFPIVLKETGIRDTAVILINLAMIDSLKEEIYYWRIRAKDKAGAYSVYSTNKSFIYTGPSIGIQDRYAGGHEPAISVYNPANTIKLAVVLPQQQNIRVSVTGLDGQQLLLVERLLPAGPQEVKFDVDLDPGVYFIKVESSEFNLFRKVLIIK
jgi:hypothetical protein